MNPVSSIYKTVVNDEDSTLNSSSDILFLK